MKLAFLLLVAVGGGLGRAFDRARAMLGCTPSGLGVCPVGAPLRRVGLRSWRLSVTRGGLERGGGLRA